MDGISVSAELLTLAIFLSTVTNRVVEGLVKPIFVKFNLDKFWLLYVAWLVGGVIVFLSGINLFDGIFGSQLVGQILTAIIAGGGANMLSDLFPSSQD